MISNMARESKKVDGPYLFIKEHMDRLGISDAQVAEKLGITANAVWKRRTDQSRLTPAKIRDFADALDIHPSALNFPPDVESLDALVAGVSGEKRSEISDIVRRLAGVRISPKG